MASRPNRAPVVESLQALHRPLHEHEDAAGLQHAMDLHERTFLRLPLEKGHQAAGTGDHVEMVVRVGQRQHRGFLEDDRTAQGGRRLLQEPPGALDHVSGVVDAVRLDGLLAGILHGRVPQPAADVQRAACPSPMYSNAVAISSSRSWWSQAVVL